MSNLWSLVTAWHEPVILTAFIALVAQEAISVILSKIGVLEKSVFGCATQTLLIVSGIVLLIPTLLLFFFWQMLVEESKHDNSSKKLGELLETFSKAWNKEVASD